VVGVAGDVMHRALDERPLPTVYLSAFQSPPHNAIVVVRAARPQVDVIGTVRDAVAALDGSVPVYRVRTMEEVVAASPGLPERRMLAGLLTALALLGLVLGAVGVFGVLAHDVASRRRELALRLALGADPRRLVRGVVRQGAVLVGAGLAAGGLLTAWVLPALTRAALGGEPVDAGSFAMAAAVLAGAALLAIVPAARRAARTDPLMAMRSD
jgi:ABC-type antimicrobial peptide transport system permease subunit